MKSTLASRIALFISGSALLSALLTATVLVIGLLASSVPLVILSGVMAFGRPFLYCALFETQPKSEKSVAIELERLSLHRSLLLGAR
jgi:hypothetical protein